MSHVPRRRVGTPPGADLPGMRVCLNPPGCPYVAPPRSLAEDLASWERLLTAALPGDGGLARLLVGDIAALAQPAS